MDIQPFVLERFFADYEFAVPHHLCASDCESLTVSELLELADEPVENLTRMWLGYTENQGSPSLRERIAEHYSGVAPDELVILSAPEEGIFVTMHALLEPGDRVVVLTPCYESLANLARHIGCEVVAWSLVEAAETPAGHGGWQLDLDRLADLLAVPTRLVVVNFPHNPTGALLDEAQWRQVADLVEGAGAWLFSDEMYRGLEYQPQQRLSSGCALGDRVVTLSGLSKAYGLPGLRSGWLAVRDRPLRQRILGWKDYTTICASAPSEYLAEIAVGVADRLIERCRRLVLDNLAVADGFFARWERLFRWNRPCAGSVALVGLRDGSAQDFSQRLISGPGILLLPGTALGSDDRHLRFGLGRRSFPANLAQLDCFLSGKWETRVDL